MSPLPLVDPVTFSYCSRSGCVWCNLSVNQHWWAISKNLFLWCMPLVHSTLSFNSPFHMSVRQSPCRAIEHPSMRLSSKIKARPAEVSSDKTSLPWYHSVVRPALRSSRLDSPRFVFISLPCLSRALLDSLTTSQCLGTSHAASLLQVPSSWGQSRVMSLYGGSVVEYKIYYDVRW